MYPVLQWLERGALVLQPNYRGSAGYGERFRSLNVRNLGVGDADLTRLSQMLDRSPNLFVDISARFAETAAIPRFAAQFIKKYAHRIAYGTDMPYTPRIFSTTFRIMESLDEHFYDNDLYFNFNYHWPMHGFGLPDDVLKKVYRETALNAFKQARNNAKA